MGTLREANIILILLCIIHCQHILIKNKTLWSRSAKADFLYPLTWSEEVYMLEMKLAQVGYKLYIFINFLFNNILCSFSNHGCHKGRVQLFAINDLGL